MSTLTAFVFGLSLAYVIESFASPETMRARIRVANRVSENSPAHNTVLMIPLTGVKIISITGAVVYFSLLLNLYQLLVFHISLGTWITVAFACVVCITAVPLLPLCFLRCAAVVVCLIL